MGSELARPHIETVVGVPFAHGVRMLPRCSLDDLVGGAQSITHDQTLDPHVAIKAMMALARHFIGEETEKEKDIANAHTLAPKMRLGRAALSEQAAAIKEHRILVTQVIRAYPPPRDPFHHIA